MSFDSVPEEIVLTILRHAGLSARLTIEGNLPRNSDTARNVSVRYDWNKNRIEYEESNRIKSVALIKPNVPIEIDFDQIEINSKFKIHFYYRLLRAFVTQIGESYRPTVCKSWYIRWKESLAWKALGSFILDDFTEEKCKSISNTKVKKFTTIPFLKTSFGDLEKSLSTTSKEGENYGILPFVKFENEVNEVLNLKFPKIPEKSVARKRKRTTAPKDAAPAKKRKK
jgi:hypothetical protein